MTKLFDYLRKKGALRAVLTVDEVVENKSYRERVLFER